MKKGHIIFILFIVSILVYFLSVSHLCSIRVHLCSNRSSRFKAAFARGFALFQIRRYARRDFEIGRVHAH